MSISSCETVTLLNENLCIIVEVWRAKDYVEIFINVAGGFHMVIEGMFFAGDMHHK